MTERNELHVSLSKGITRGPGQYMINAMRMVGGPLFPAMTEDDVIMVRTWDEPDPHSGDNGRYCALNARDLWLAVQIKRAGTKKRAAELAAQLAGLSER